jgi:hypothetical protein
MRPSGRPTRRPASSKPLKTAKCLISHCNPLQLTTTFKPTTKFLRSACLQQSKKRYQMTITSLFSPYKITGTPSLCQPFRLSSLKKPPLSLLLVQRTTECSLTAFKLSICPSETYLKSTISSFNLSCPAHQMYYLTTKATLLRIT